MVFRRRKITDRVQTLVDEVLHMLQPEPGSGVQTYRPRTIQATRLEQRILMSASPIAIVAEAAAEAVENSLSLQGADHSRSDQSATDDEVAAETAETTETEAEAATNRLADRQSGKSDGALNSRDSRHNSDQSELNAVRGPELVVIDYRVKDADTLLTSLLSNNRDIRLLRLDSDEDGLEQVTEKLEQLGNVSAIHLLTHGRDGEILLGTTRLNAATLAEHTPELLAWQHALTADADLLIYGCDVADTVEGQDFVESLRRLTGADIAASSDRTGSPAMGGDWDLEFRSGTLEVSGLFSATVMETWQHQLGAGQTITVTTTNDIVDGNVTSVTGLLDALGADGKISLREALLAANTNADVDEIILSPGEYRILISGKDESAVQGDFDVTQDLSIRGAGATTTIINGQSIDRIFDIHGSAKLTISGVTITGGDTRDNGGGLAVSRNASLAMSDAVVSGNSTNKNGGGLYNAGSLTMTNVMVSNNVAGTDGGGLNNAGIATLAKVTFAGNSAADGGGISHDGVGSTLSLINVTLSGNNATSDGGGLYAGEDASLQNVTIAFNKAGHSGAGVRGFGSTVTMQNTLLASNRLANLTASNFSGDVTSLGHNLDSDGTALLSQTSDLSGVDPLLEELADYGGFTLTHALRYTSIAIDAGTNSGAPVTDQRGAARDGAADIGAYEFDRAFLSTSQFQVNTTTSGDQVTSAETRGSQQAIARDHAGNYIVTWSSNGQDGSGWGVYARRFDAFGKPLSAEFRVNGVTSDSQQWARIAADTAGNFAITWTSTNQDGTEQSIYARRFNAAGVAQGNEFLVNTTTTGVQKNSMISMNADGRFVIAWQGEGPGDTSGIFYRRFSSGGTALDATDRLANTTTGDTQINPAVAMDQSGRFVVLWQESSRLYVQRFSSSGAAQGGRIQVDNILSTSADPSLAMDAAGNFTVVYREENLLPGIWARGFNADGSEKYIWFQADSGSSSSPSITMADDGQFILAWQGTGDGDGTGIYARKYFANGTANGTVFLVNQDTAGNQDQPSVTMLDPENFVVVWSGRTMTDINGVSARQFGTAVSKTLVAQTDFVTTATNTTVVVDVLANDSRPDNGEAIRLDVSDPTHGTSTITSSGQISYTPDTSYAGGDTLTYLISDGTDGTTHYWSLSGTGVDSVGSAHGTLQGTSTIAGSFGTALQFDELNDFVDIPDFAYNTDFSVSFDFKIDENTGSEFQYLYSHGNPLATNSLNIYLGETGRSGYANVLLTVFGDANDALDYEALDTNIGTLIGDSQWHTYTLTVDKAFGSRVYIDGQLRASAAGRGGDTFNPTGNAILGSRFDQDPIRFLGGGMDSVRIFDRALAASDVTSLNLGESASPDSSQSTASIFVTVQNANPIVVTNGPYATSVGVPVTFSADGTSDLNGDALTYEWDLNYDGVTFDNDITGSTVTRNWPELQASGVFVGTNSIALRVVDARGAETIETTTLQVTPNAAPANIALSSMIAPGGQSGALVGTLTSSDSTAGDVPTYTVSDTRFEIVSGQLKLMSGQSLSRENETSISLDITSTDLAGNQIRRTFVLTVGNSPVLARNNIYSTNENSGLTLAAPGVVANDDRSAASVTSGAVLAFDAASDTNGDATWQDGTGVAGHDFTLGTGVTRNVAPITNHHGILSSFSFDGSGTSGAVSSESLATLPGNPTDGAATFELWFRPAELTKKYILIDSGSAQPGTGLSLRLNGTQLEFSVYKNGSGPAVTSSISTQLAGGDFVQFSGTVRISGGVASVEMFVNGLSVGTNSASGFTAWSDTLENIALGRIEGTVDVLNVAGADRFAGEIAQFRFYDTALSLSQLQANFNAVAGTQAGLTVSDTDTTSDSTRGSVSLNSSGALTYNPNGQFDSLAGGATAIDSFRYTITDGTRTDTAQVQVTITGVNDAPVMLSASPSLSSIVANTSSSPVTVATLLGASVTDVDSGAVRGIAVAGTSGTGSWQYSSNGTTWTSFGSVSASQALLLRSTDQIRFSGSGLAAGSATLTYSAWDQTTGPAGTKFDTAVSGRGGTTAFSTTTNTATLTLQRVNLAPTGTADSYTLNEDSPFSTMTANGWFNNQWNTRQKISFNNGSGVVLTNQAVLVTLDSTRIDYTRTMNNGYDLRFVDANGSLLNHEIETWDEAGVSRVWVLVPQIDAASITDFVWMYYGNSQAVNTQNSAAVWTTQEAVLHLGETVTDSSPNAIDVREFGTANSTGISGGARTFDGVNDFVRFDDSADLDNLFRNGGTISAWINPAGWGENGYGRIADKANSTFGSNNGTGWALQLTSTGRLSFEHGFSSDQGQWQTASPVISLNTWKHVTVVYNAASTANSPKVFVDGVEVAVSRTQSPSGSYLSDSANDLTVGNHAAATTRTFNGRIDEFRAGKTSLTAAQVSADYRSMVGTLTSVSPAEVGPGGVLSNDTDPENDPLSATLLTGPANSQSFSLRNDGTFAYTPTANYNGTDTFTYAVSDGTTTSSPITVTLNIRPVNDAPTSISLSSTSFAGYTHAAVVGSVTILDPDVGDSQTITVDDTRFEIIAGQLKLKTGRSLHPVLEPTVILSLTATDSMGETRVQQFTLTTIDPNTSPALSVTSIVNSVKENTVFGSALHVATIAVSDDGLGTNALTLSGTNAASFELIGQDLFLRAGTLLNFEQASSLNVVVEVDDPMLGASPDDTKTFRISVNDVNESPSVTLAPVIGAIAENSDTRSAIRVADIVIADDAMGTNQITLLGADASRFEVIGNGLFIKAGTILNYESQSQLDVTVQLDDPAVGGAPDGSADLSLQITNVNEAPVPFTDGPYTIAEGDSLTVNASGSSDPDGDVLTYAWDLNGDGLFENASGVSPTKTWSELVASSPAVNDDGARNISVRVTDSAGLSTVLTTTLTIINTSPTITVTGRSIVNSAEVYQLNLASTDPGQDTISEWTIHWGDGATETVSGALTSATHVFTTPGGSRSISVTGTDEDGTHAMSGGPFVVAINNRAPVNLALSDLKVTENIPGATVGNVSFTDVDSGDRHTVTVSDARFEVVGGVLRLRAGESLDFTAEPSVPLQLTVTDLSGASSSRNFTLIVNRMARGSADSYAVDGTQQLSVANPSSGLLTNDVDDDGDGLIAILKSGPAHAAAFGLNANGTFWYRAATGYSGTDTFRYCVSDGEIRSAPITVTLTVNQPASIAFVQTVSAMNEGVTLTSPVKLGEFVVTDDGIGTNIIRLSGLDASRFEVDGAGNLYLKAGVTLDYEMRRTLTVSGTVDDTAIAGSPDNFKLVTLAIRDLNDTPATVGLSNLTINEDAGLQTVNTSSRFSDQDGDVLQYSVRIVNQSAGLLDSISIDRSTGVLRYQSALNAFGSAIVEVTATDPEGAVVQALSNLQILAINDTPVVRNYSGSTFSGQPFTQTGTGVLTGASDAESQPMQAVLIQAPAHGTVTLGADGSFVYRPVVGFFGYDTFTFAATDGIQTGAAAVATINVQAPFVGSGSSGTGNPSGTSGAAASSTSTGSSSATGSTSSSASTSTSPSSASSATTSSGSPSAQIAPAQGDAGITGAEQTTTESNSIADGQINDREAAEQATRQMAQTSDEKAEGSAARKESSSDLNSGPSDRDSVRRSLLSDSSGRGLMNSSWDSRSALTPVELHRQQVYRELAVHTGEQINSFEEKLTRNFKMEGRVVGSVGVVTTGFSVGYLIWAVRGGMLLSGVLSQIPAWTMLDPLMVIDGDGKEDDKESLQTLMDRQQAKLNTENKQPEMPEPVDESIAD